MTGISYEQALAAWRMSSPAVARDNPLPREDLLARYHPDYRAETRTTIKVGPNAGDPCHRLVADWLHTNARINEAALAGATVTDTDVLVIGGGAPAVLRPSPPRRPVQRCSSQRSSAWATAIP